MTLPELVAAANSCADGTLMLSKEQRDYLLLLLVAYADDVLDDGQCLHFGTIRMIKNIRGQASISLENFDAANKSDEHD